MKNLDLPKNGPPGPNISEIFGPMGPNILKRAYNICSHFKIIWTFKTFGLHTQKSAAQLANDNYLDGYGELA